VQGGDTLLQQASVAQLLWDKARAELERLDEARVAACARIDTMEKQIELLQAEASEATHAHNQARATLDNMKHLVALQERRTALTKGTPAENEAKREIN
jgi:predicted  nucleic acid-binding Zn-ribbon protein